MRVLHLLDAASPQAAPATLAMMADAVGRLDGIDQHVLLLGGQRLRHMADDVGLTGAQCVGVPLGRAMLGWPTVQRAMRAIGDGTGRFDLVHCWSVGALSFAALAVRATPRVLTLTVTPPPHTIRWLRMLVGEQGETTGLARSSRAALLPISTTIRRAVLGGGVAESNVHVLRPPIDMGRISQSTRAALRESWGLEDDTTRVIALLGDPPWADDALVPGRAVGLAREAMRPTGPQLRVLVHPDRTNRRRAERLLLATGRYDRFVRDPRAGQPWATLPGCDLALAMGPSAGGLSLLWAMAANVPIIGEATYAASEVVEDRHSAMLAMPDEPFAIAQRVQQLLTEPELAYRLRDTARHEAYSFFSPKRYRDALAGVYRQLVDGRPVEVPAMESTGGLRFAGRA